MYNVGMKAALLALAVLSGCLAYGQTPPDVTLGAPEFVAKNVKNVFWAVDGRTLAYTSETNNGLAIGVYDLDQKDGKIVYTLGKDDQIDTFDWLRMGKKAILVVRNKKDVTNMSVVVLDAHELTARQVWTHQYANDSEPSIDVDISPSLPHALLTLQAGKLTETWVLTLGASGVVFSRDIAAAEAQGQSFAGWSTGGTAIFGSGAGQNDTFRLSGKDLNGAKVQLEGAVNLVFKTKADTRQAAEIVLQAAPATTTTTGGVPVLNEIPIISRFFLKMQPSIALGATCFECMPANGALRTVKFPGYFEEKPGPEGFPVAHTKLIRMVLGKSESPAQSLWLVTDEPQQEIVAEGQPARPAAEPKGGVLVSAQADSVWPSLYTRSIAFGWNGVLFVRTVKYGGK